MMNMGNMTKDFVPVGKEEQAEIKNEDNSEKVGALLGIGKKIKIAIFPIYLFFCCRLRVDDQLLLQAEAEGWDGMGEQGIHMFSCFQLGRRHRPCYLRAHL